MATQRTDHKHKKANRTDAEVGRKIRHDRYATGKPSDAARKYYDNFVRPKKKEE